MGSANEWANSNTTPSSNSALAGLCIIPPEELWPAIQSIRKVHDKRFRQWFPNIPLIFPFFRSSPITNELLLGAAEAMAPALARFSPFQVTMDRMEVVFHRNRWCVWLLARPNDALLDLQSTVAELFPVYGGIVSSGPDFVPHVALGQWPSRAEAAS
eukprot:CAMPEP_0172192128 /NCGR_PEP_ID=MMETSP1050-20130122/24139_1 /TAXON_ID=233186 /ORGANISM="Cryptomonas curvata, Strain CCAP979/52" /LENGTH=156 /DNA_ID=CAMNT_0012867363 /DNA_START=373 /DNA_END=840 /DNA_ORIENTATION=-